MKPQCPLYMTFLQIDEPQVLEEASESNLSQHILS